MATTESRRAQSASPHQAPSSVPRPTPRLGLTGQVRRQRWRTIENCGRPKVSRVPRCLSSPRRKSNYSQILSISMSVTLHSNRSKKAGNQMSSSRKLVLICRSRKWVASSMSAVVLTTSPRLWPSPRTNRSVRPCSTRVLLSSVLSSPMT